MAKLFDSVASRRPGRNKFDLSHERKFSFNMGKLIPMMVQEIVPGDSFRVRSEIMLRFAPLLAPIMHRVNVTTHYFFVPNRLIWDEWEDFITGGRLGTAEPVAPFIKIDDTSKVSFFQGEISDYLGIPNLSTATISSGNEINISALPFRAYQVIFDEYYRDQNLSASSDISKASGEVTGGELAKLHTMQYRAWEKDYFTSALPFAQRGGSVSAPMSSDHSIPTVAYETAGGTFYGQGAGLEVGVDGVLIGETPSEGAMSLDVAGMGMNINELRRSIRLQEWLEKNARGGARYVEQILSHFGVKSSDARLQRPEYLGGGKAPVVVSEVLQTMQNDTGNPLATMGGHGTSFGTTNGFKRSFEEHGFVIGIVSVLPRTAYQQGIDRMWSRADKFDYYWPEFANIGEQEVKNKELFYLGDTTPTDGPEGTFGYQSRYAEYKYGCSSVHGEMRTNLDFWHMGRKFSAAPSLNADFVTSDPTTRIFAVTEEEFEDHLYCQLYNRVDALRPMPYFGTPTL